MTDVLQIVDSTLAVADQVIQTVEVGYVVQTVQQGGGTPSGTVVSETSYGQAATAGTATAYSRGDHTHGSPPLGTTAGTAAAGNDSRIVNAVQTSRLITAGTGLTGGGDLTADRTLAVSYGTGANTSAQGNDSRIVGAVQTSRQVNSGTGLTGGGDLSADRTLAVAYGTAAGTAAQGNDSRLARTFGYPASNYGMVALSIDPALCQTASAIGSGLIWAVRVPVFAGVAFSNIWFAIRTAGTWDGVTSGNQLGLYNDSGVQLDTTAVDNTLWTSTGWRGGALLGGTQAAQSSDRDVYMLIIIRGASVAPSPAWPPGPSDSSAPYVAQGPGGGNRRAMYTSGNTALPASFNPTSYGTATGYVAVCGAS